MNDLTIRAGAAATVNRAELAGDGDRLRPLTILQVLPALGEQGGVERGTVDVARAIVEAGGCSLVASAGGPLVHELARAGAHHAKLPLDSKNPLVIRANIRRLAELIGANDVDIVHARSRAPAWSAYYAAKRTGRAFVTTFHGTYRADTLPKRRYNAVMARGERVIAISQFIAGHVGEHYGVPADRIPIIHRGTDFDRFTPDAMRPERLIELANLWRIADGQPVVLLPGRLTRWKGQLVFIDAIAELARRDLRCILLGDAQGRERYRRELEERIVGRGLGGIIRMIDRCNDMPAAYMLSDVVVSASIEPEAFGRVLVEAQALGRPVIGTDHGGARETVVPNETGWLVPPGDPTALAGAIDRSLRLGAEDRARMARAAIAYVRGRFSREGMCRETLAVYREVLAARSGR